jgi:hypothetical protein
LRHGFPVGLPCFLFGGFAGFPEVEKDGEIFNGGVDGIIEPDPVFVELYVLENFGGALVVVPETRA